MSTIWTRLRRAALAVALVSLLPACGDGRASPAPGATSSSAPASAVRLPRLVDVGANKCIPCKAMAPILDQLRADFTGRLEVQFVDVWANPDAGRPYGIRVIPTQIFYAADGRELSRHEGFMSREEILARWRSVGLTF
jgi:thioredoxin 1